MSDDFLVGDDASVAGASARAEFERRAEQHRAEVDDDRTWLVVLTVVGFAVGAVAVALGSIVGLWIFVGTLSLVGSKLFLPRHSDSWRIGATGEERTAAALEKLKSEGFVILHDRLIPGSKANIDHIVIGPPGVAIVETKSFARRLRVRGDDVYVGGYLKTGQTVGEAKREALAVGVALGEELKTRRLTVRPILCVHRAELPWLNSAPQGVSIVDGRGLLRTLRKSRPVLGPEDIRLLARLANERLRPAAAPVLASRPRPSSSPVMSPPAAGPLTPIAAEWDERFLPPERREQLRVAREARMRTTEKRTYWTPRGVAEGNAPPTIPPKEPNS